VWTPLLCRGAVYGVCVLVTRCSLGDLIDSFITCCVSRSRCVMLTRSCSSCTWHCATSYNVSDASLSTCCCEVLPVRNRLDLALMTMFSLIKFCWRIKTYFRMCGVIWCLRYMERSWVAFHDCVDNFTARRVCIARTMLWQDVCPSVCLSATRRYSVERLNISSKFIHRRVGLRTPF